MSRRRSSDMAPIPSWVVLRDNVPVFPHEQKPQESQILGRAKKLPIATTAGAEDEDPIAPSLLRAITLDAHLVQPPEISTLSLRANFAELKDRHIVGEVLTVQDGLIVVSVHAFHVCDDQGRYFLVHDAAAAENNNTLSLIPDIANKFPPGQGPKFTDSPVALRLDDGSYALAELGFEHDKIFGDQELLPMSGGITLFRWSSTSPGKWTSRGGLRFHRQMRPPSKRRHTHSFQADLSFVCQGRAFWVDLLRGAVVCDLRSADTELRFVPLPEDCKWECREALARGTPTSHRTMGCVGKNSVVRFVEISVLGGGLPDDDDPPLASEIVVNTWTLSMDGNRGRWEWEKDDDMTLALRKLWKSESFEQERLSRRAVPQNPVLCAGQDGLVVFLFSDYYYNSRGDRLCRGEFLITVDMRRKTLVSCSHLPLNSGLYTSRDEVPEERTPGGGFDPHVPDICGGMFSGDGMFSWDDKRTLDKAKEKKRRRS